MEWSRTTAGFLNHIILYACLSRGENQLEATGIWLNNRIVIVHFMPRCDLVIPRIFPVVLPPALVCKLHRSTNTTPNLTLIFFSHTSYHIS